MSITGADLGNLAEINQIAQSTSVLADQTAQETNTRTQRMRSMVEQLLAEQTADFDTVFGELEDLARKADERLQSGQWQGSARDQAVQASTAFKTALAKLKTDVDNDTRQHEQKLRTRTTEVSDTVQGSYRQVMAHATTAFSSYGATVQAYADELQTIDQSVKFSGGI